MGASSSHFRALGSLLPSLCRACRRGWGVGGGLACSHVPGPRAGPCRAVGRRACMQRTAAQQARGVRAWQSGQGAGAGGASAGAGWADDEPELCLPPVKMMMRRRPCASKPPCFSAPTIPTPLCSSGMLPAAAALLPNAYRRRTVLPMHRPYSSTHTLPTVRPPPPLPPSPARPAAACTLCPPAHQRTSPWCTVPVLPGLLTSSAARPAPACSWCPPAPGGGC